MDKLKNNIAVVMVILGLIGSTGAGFTKFARMEAKIEQLSNIQAPDLSSLVSLEKEVAIVQREIKILNLQIQEIKETNKNPLRWLRK